MSDLQLDELGPEGAILAVIEHRGGWMTCRAITDALQTARYEWPAGRTYPDYSRVFGRLRRLADAGVIVRIDSMDGALWGRP